MALDPYFISEFRVPDCEGTYKGQFHHWIWLQKATGVMLQKQGLITKEQAAQIAKGLDEVEANLTIDKLDGGRTDVYNNVMYQLEKLIGDTANLLHQGRSRNDMNCCCDRMELREFILQICEGMNDVMTEILEQAEANKETIITYYTYGQPSQPGTYGHYLTMFFEELSRDFVRLQAAYKTTNKCPMGHATGIGTQVDLDPQYLSDLLGFDGRILHSLDGISSPDFLLETEAAVAIMMNNFSRVAQDLLLWTSYELRFMDVDPTISGSSSIMPQKKNPAAIPLMRGNTAKGTTMLINSLTELRNTSQFSVNELWVDLFTDVNEYLLEFKRVFGALKLIFKHSTFRTEESYKYTANNFTGASTMAEVLSDKYGVPFTKTHHIVGGMIKELMANDAMDVKNLTGEMMAKYSEPVMGKPIIMTDEEVQEMLDPVFGLNQKTSGGTPKLADFDAMMPGYRKTLEDQKAWVAEVRKTLSDARAAADKGL